MRSRKLTCASINFIEVLLSQSVHSQLQAGFYGNSCSLAEFIVKDRLETASLGIREWLRVLLDYTFMTALLELSKRANLLILVALVSGLAPIGSSPFHLKYIGKSQYFTIKI